RTRAAPARAAGSGAHRARKGGEGSIGVSQKESTHRPPFWLIRIEQTLACEPLGRQRELPAEVPRVLNAGVPPCRPSGAVDVGCTAGKEDPTGAIVRDLPMVQMESCEPRRIAYADRSL